MISVKTSQANANDCCIYGDWGAVNARRSKNMFSSKSVQCAVAHSITIFFFRFAMSRALAQHTARIKCTHIESKQITKRHIINKHSRIFNSVAGTSFIIICICHSRTILSHSHSVSSSLSLAQHTYAHPVYLHMLAIITTTFSANLTKFTWNIY